MNANCYFFSFLVSGQREGKAFPKEVTPWRKAVFLLNLAVEKKQSWLDSVFFRFGISFLILW